MPDRAAQSASGPSRSPALKARRSAEETEQRQRQGADARASRYGAGVVTRSAGGKRQECAASMRRVEDLTHAPREDSATVCPIPAIPVRRPSTLQRVTVECRHRSQQGLRNGEQNDADVAFQPARPRRAACGEAAAATHQHGFTGTTDRKLRRATLAIRPSRMRSGRIRAPWHVPPAG